MCVRDYDVHTVKALGSECVPTQIPVETSPPLWWHSEVGPFGELLSHEVATLMNNSGLARGLEETCPWAPLGLCRVGTQCHGAIPEAERSPHQAPRVF